MYHGFLYVEINPCITHRSRVFEAAFGLGTVVGNRIMKLNTSGLVEADVDAPALFTNNKEHGLKMTVGSEQAKVQRSSKICQTLHLFAILVSWHSALARSEPA